MCVHALGIFDLEQSIPCAAKVYGQQMSGFQGNVMC